MLFTLIFSIAVEDTPLGLNIALLVYLEALFELLNEFGAFLFDFSLKTASLISSDHTLAIHFLGLITHAFYVLLEETANFHYVHLSLTVGERLLWCHRLVAPGSAVKLDHELFDSGPAVPYSS